MEVPGSGELLDCRRAGHNVVLFETDQISVITPRGYLDDPFDYMPLATGIHAISNPVVHNDWVYFIAQTGLLYRTNGLTISDLGSPFDQSYTDFEDVYEVDVVTYTNEDGDEVTTSVVSDRRVVYTMHYDPNTDSLIIYKAGDDTVYFVSVAMNAMSEMSLPQNSSDEYPYAFVVTFDGDARKVWGAWDGGINHELTFGDRIINYDKLDSSQRMYGQLLSGYAPFVPDGQRATIHQITVHTYTEGGAATPDLLVKIRELGETEWQCPGTTYGTIAVDGTAETCTGSTTVFSHHIDDGDDATVEFTLPVQAAACRVYLEDSGTYTLQTAGTDYTVTDTYEITFSSAPSSSEALYVYWDRAPYVVVEVDDYIETDSGYHKVNTITDASNLVLNWYATDTDATHRKAQQLPEGEGETEIGVPGLADGFQIQINVIPRNAPERAPTTVKVVGLDIWYEVSGPDKMSDDEE
jgi:hypothetical protein